MTFGLFGPASVAWKIDRERAVLIGGTRALLMQLAHPKVATGVDEHSDFRRRPFRRLARTVTLSLDGVFGDRQRALAAARVINSAHANVRGAGYSAFDPDLLLWVMATLVDTAVLSYELFVGPLTAAERDAFYEETRRATRLLGLEAESAPPDFAALREWMRERIATGEVRVTGTGLAAARDTLYPPAAWFIPRPVNDAVAFVTAGLLPPALRAQFGLPWSLRREAAFEVFVRTVRATVPLLTPALRYVPQAREAEARVA